MRPRLALCSPYWSSASKPYWPATWGPARVPGAMLCRGGGGGWGYVQGCGLHAGRAAGWPHTGRLSAQEQGALQAPAGHALPSPGHTHVVAALLRLHACRAGQGLTRDAALVTAWGGTSHGMHGCICSPAYTCLATCWSPVPFEGKNSSPPAKPHHQSHSRSACRRRGSSPRPSAACGTWTAQRPASQTGPAAAKEGAGGARSGGAWHAALPTQLPPARPRRRTTHIIHVAPPAPGPHLGEITEVESLDGVGLHGVGVVAAGASLVGASHGATGQGREGREQQAAGRGGAGQVGEQWRVSGKPTCVLPLTLFKLSGAHSVVGTVGGGHSMPAYSLHRASAAAQARKSSGTCPLGAQW